jgi:hypothetical protein
MKPKTLFWQLGTLATTLSLTACASVSSVPVALCPSVGVLHLQPMETYQAKSAETWHSGARYQALELELLDATSALKQLQAR